MLTRRPPERSLIPMMPMRTAFERLFGDWPVTSWDTSVTELAPPLDVDETNDGYEVRIDLPGVKPEDVEILVDGRTLTISGRFSEEEERREGKRLLRERRRGEFMRAVALPGMVQAEDATTEFQNGELIIRLPKAAENRAKRIEIRNGGSSTGQLSTGQQGQQMSGQQGQQMSGQGQQGQQGQGATRQSGSSR